MQAREAREKNAVACKEESVKGEPPTSCIGKRVWKRLHSIVREGVS